MQIRTDLAIEAREQYLQERRSSSTSERMDAAAAANTKAAARSEDEIEGVNVSERTDGQAKVTSVEITTQQAADTLGQKQGTYITIEIPNINYEDSQTCDHISDIIRQELTGILGDIDNRTFLVVGLGNRNITADALGPKVVEKLLITRHLLSYMPEMMDGKATPVCAVSPGVLGITGIETGEIVCGVADRVKPDVIIAIDALAARRIDRVNTTVQITNTGISPGSGVGNHRKALDEQSLGVPVIAIGVPTVVDAVTMANDAIFMAIDALEKEAKADTALKLFDDFGRQNCRELILEVMSPAVKEMTVTPKEVDAIMEKMAKLLARGMNLALQKELKPDDIDSYMV